MLNTCGKVSRYPVSPVTQTLALKTQTIRTEQEAPTMQFLQLHALQSTILTASNLGIRVLAQVGIQNGVTNLVAHFICNKKHKISK